MALMPKLHFEGEYDESLKAVSNSNLRKQRVIPNGKLVYADSNSLPPKLPSDTMLFTTDTRELYIGTGDSIKRVNLGNDGEIIDKTDYLTKVEAAKYYIQKEALDPDNVITKDLLQKALDDLNNTINDILNEINFKADKDDVFTKKEANDLFIDKNEFDNGLSKKVDIEHLTPTGNHTFVRNNNNGVSLEYQNMANDKNSSIKIEKDKIIINSSDTNGEKIGSKIYINQKGVYYTNSNDDNFENDDEVMTKKSVASIESKINNNLASIEEIRALAQKASSDAIGAVNTADLARNEVEGAKTSAATAIATAQDALDKANEANKNIQKALDDSSNALKEATDAKSDASDALKQSNANSESIKTINSSINNLTTITSDHETRITKLEKSTTDIDLDKINQDISDVRKMASDAKTKADSVDDKVNNDHEPRIKALEQIDLSNLGDLNKLPDQIKSINEQINTLITNINNKEDALDKKDKELTDRIDALEKALRELTERVNEYHKEVPITVKKIASIKVPDIFKNTLNEVQIGTIVNLPNEIEIVFDDGTTGKIGINYDNVFNNTNVGNIQNITGTLALPLDGSIENPNNLTLNTSFLVYDYITNVVNNVINKTVPFGTAFDDIQGLPLTITCNLASGNKETFDIDWSEAKSNYNPNNSTLQNLIGHIVEKDNVKNINNLDIELNVTVEERTYNIESVANDTTIHEVEYETSFSSLGLPVSVDVTLDDGSTKKLLVNWNSSTYINTDYMNEQTINGTLVLTDGITNTNNLIATYKVKVKEKPIVTKDITWVDTFTGVKEVDYGTTFENLNLPLTVEVKYSDGTTSGLAINWLSSDYISTNTNSNQVITGELILIDGVTNTNNYDVKYTVKVKEQILNIKSVNNDTTIHEVEYGTIYSSLGLPNKVTVTLDDDTTRQLSVNWSTDYSEIDTINEQTFTGTLILIDNVTNTNNLTATYKVKVKDKPTINIKSIANDNTVHNVEYDTQYSNLSLPDKIEVTLDDNTTRTLNINWISSFYSSQFTDDVQTISGNLVLPEGITNTNNLTASYKVKVKEQLNVTWVETFSKENVEVGTSIADLNLPSEVKVKYNDNSEEQVSVTWNTSDYNPDQTSGEQTIEGTLVIPEGKYNKNNMTSKFKVTIKASSQGDEWEWTEYVKLESFANNIKKFPSKIGHDFTDENVMGVWDEDDDTLMLEEPTVEFRYLGCMKTLTEGDKQTVTLLTEEQVHDPSIMNQNLMAVYPDGIKTPLGTGYDTEENIEAYKSKILNEFGFTSNRGLFLENGLLRFEVAAHENNVYLVRKKKK